MDFHLVPTLKQHHATSDVYMDDLVFTTAGTPQQVASRLVQAARKNRAIVKDAQEGFGAELAMSNAGIAGSDRSTVMKIKANLQRHFGKLGHVNEKDAACNLGIDFAPGARRASFRQAKTSTRAKAGKSDL